MENEPFDVYDFLEEMEEDMPAAVEAAERIATPVVESVPSATSPVEGTSSSKPGGSASDGAVPADCREDERVSAIDEGSNAPAPTVDPPHHADEGSSPVGDEIREDAELAHDLVASTEQNVDDIREEMLNSSVPSPSHFASMREYGGLVSVAFRGAASRIEPPTSDDSLPSHDEEISALKYEVESLKGKLEDVCKRLSDSESSTSRPSAEGAPDVHKSVQELRDEVRILSSRVAVLEADAAKSREKRASVETTTPVSMEDLDKLIRHMMQAQAVSFSTAMTAGKDLDVAVDRAILSLISEGFGINRAVGDPRTWARLKHLQVPINDMRAWFATNSGRYPYRWERLGGEYVKFTESQAEFVDRSAPISRLVVRGPVPPPSEDAPPKAIPGAKRPETEGGHGRGLPEMESKRLKK